MPVVSLMRSNLQERIKNSARREPATLVWHVTLTLEVFNSVNSEVSKGGVPGSTLVSVISTFPNSNGDCCISVGPKLSGSLSGIEGGAVHRMAAPLPLQETLS